MLETIIAGLQGGAQLYDGFFCVVLKMIIRVGFRDNWRKFVSWEKINDK